MFCHRVNGRSSERERERVGAKLACQFASCCAVGAQATVQSGTEAATAQWAVPTRQFSHCLIIGDSCRVYIGPYRLLIERLLGTACIRVPTVAHMSTARHSTWPCVCRFCVPWRRTGLALFHRWTTSLLATRQISLQVRVCCSPIVVHDDANDDKRK